MGENSDEKLTEYTMIPNEIIDQMIIRKLSGVDLKIILFIIRLSWGTAGCTEDEVKNFCIIDKKGDIGNTCGDEKRIAEHLDFLKSNNIIFYQKNNYCFNKYFETWAVPYITESSLITLKRNLRINLSISAEEIKKWNQWSDLNILEFLINFFFPQNEVIDFSKISAKCVNFFRKMRNFLPQNAVNSVADNQSQSSSESFLNIIKENKENLLHEKQEKNVSLSEEKHENSKKITKQSFRSSQFPELASPPDISSLPEKERELLSILYSVKNWPYNLENDLITLNKIIEDYDNKMNLKECFGTYYRWRLDNPITAKNNVRSNLESYCKRGLEIGRYGKTGNNSVNNNQKLKVIFLGDQFERGGQTGEFDD